MFAEPSDGNVAVEETRLRPGFPAELILVPLTHTSIAQSAKVAQLVTHFLKHGCFLQGSVHEQNDDSNSRFTFQ